MPREGATHYIIWDIVNVSVFNIRSQELPDGVTQDVYIQSENPLSFVLGQLARLLLYIRLRIVSIVFQIKVNK